MDWKKVLHYNPLPETKNLEAIKPLNTEGSFPGRQGKPVVEAAWEEACLRLRPILMTSFAFILGCVPLSTASGAGALSRQVMGTAVIGGMLAANVIAIFLIPVTFYGGNKLAHRGGPKKEEVRRKENGHGEENRRRTREPLEALVSFYYAMGGGWVLKDDGIAVSAAAGSPPR